MPEYVDITLDPVEVQGIYDYVIALKADKGDHGINNLHFDVNNSAIGIDMMGNLGNLAACKVLGVPMDMEVRTHGDLGYDIDHKSGKIEVKTSKLDSLIFNQGGSGKFKADSAILVQFLGADKTKTWEDPRFRVWGWIDRELFMSKHYLRNYGYGDRLVVDAYNLLDISEII